MDFFFILMSSDCGAGGVFFPKKNFALKTKKNKKRKHGSVVYYEFFVSTEDQL